MSQDSASLSEDQLDGPEALQAAAARKQRLFDFVILLGLLVAILIVYAQVGSFEFSNLDDPAFVYQNPHVANGFTRATIQWAFTSQTVGHWVPVTALSHVLAVNLFGMESGMHHLLNVAFHILTAFLLFAVLRRATGSRGPSAFVAFAFALHPLNVESVAWVTERKEVLAGLFWFLALYLYVRYAEHPSTGRYLEVAAAFLLALMSKAVAISFPLAALLFDVWPFRRIERPDVTWRTLIAEKIPLLLLSVAATYVAYLTQGASGAIQAFPAPLRFYNALMSYGIYLRQIFWPTRLAVFYPYPQAIILGWAAASIITLLCVSALVVSVRRSRPYLAVGWFWFLATMLPTIGIIQAGKQAHADRYMYIPMVGLLIALAWGAADVCAKWPRLRWGMEIAGMAVCLACLVVARTDAAYWQNSGTLFQRALEVTDSNLVALEHLGLYESNTQRLPAAIAHYQQVLALDPSNGIAEAQIGADMERLEGCAPAMPHFEAAIRLDPNVLGAYLNLGNCLALQGDNAGAVRNFGAAVHLNPQDARSLEGLALSLSKFPDRLPEAIQQFQAAIRLQPRNAKLRGEFGMLLARSGRGEEAIRQLQEVYELEPFPDSEISATLNRLRAESNRPAGGH